MGIIKFPAAQRAPCPAPARKQDAQNQNTTVSMYVCAGDYVPHQTVSIFMF